MFKNTVISISVLFALCISQINCTSIRRYYFNGILYEDFTPESANVMFIRTADADWQAVSQLIKKNNMTYKSVFCTVGDGAWVVYPEKDYQYGPSSNFQIMVGEECLTAEDIESVQPLGAMNDKVVSALFTFTSPYFTSPTKVVKTGSTSGEIRSLFQIGHSNWTIEGSGANGKVKYCLQRGFSDDGKSICSLSDIETQLGIKGSLSIKEGCGNNDKIFSLTTCYTRGSYKVTVQKDITLPKVKSLCKADMSASEKALLAKFTNLMSVWNGRIRGNFGLANPAFKMPHVDDDLKTHMLWNIFGVFEHACTTLSPGYLNILGGIFWHHLNAAWERKPETKETESDRWMEVDNYIMACQGEAMTDLSEGGVEDSHPVFERPHPPLPEPDYVFHDLSDADRKSPKPSGRRAKRDIGAMKIECRADSLGMVITEEQNQDALQYLIGGQMYDTIIEQIWLIFNFVSPYCADAQHYVDNFWSYFVTVLRKNYLNPVVDQWLKPGPWALMYPSMFNGFDLEAEKTNIISCIQTLMTRTPRFIPLSRPNIMFNSSWDNNNNNKPKLSKPLKNTKNAKKSNPPKQSDGQDRKRSLNKLTGMPPSGQGTNSSTPVANAKTPGLPGRAISLKMEKEADKIPKNPKNLKRKGHKKQKKSGKGFIKKTVNGTQGLKNSTEKSPNLSKIQVQNSSLPVSNGTTVAALI